MGHTHTDPCCAPTICPTCKQCTMCYGHNPRYDHGGKLPAGNYGVSRGVAEGYTSDGEPYRVEWETITHERVHQPDQHHATHHPDGVLHTFTGPNNDGTLHTWAVTTRHPENTTQNAR